MLMKTNTLPLRHADATRHWINGQTTLQSIHYADMTNVVGWLIGRWLQINIYNCDNLYNQTKWLLVTQKQSNSK